MIFDSHCHLDAPEFDGDRAAVIERAEAAGVSRQLVPAIARAGWEKLRDVCALRPGLHPAYGLHPMLVADHRPEHVKALGDWVEHERPAAIGECGLDFYIEGLDGDSQRWFFDRQLELARDCGLPVIVHARRAVEEVIASLRRVGGLRGVVHSYSGSEEQARQLFKLDFMLGIGGPVTFDRANRLRRLVATMPLDMMLLETDSPDQPDVLHRGQRNEPARILRILEVTAALRKVAVEVVASATTSNAFRLFGLPAT